MHASDTVFYRLEPHNARGGLEATILDALVAAGKKPADLNADDLAAIDELQVRGRKAISDLAGDIGLEKSMQVLDVGSGLGGAARYIAKEFGCRVTGTDMSSYYCQVATTLTARLGLDSLVSFRQGNAIDLPFPDASFDVVWTQLAAMNIPDKTELYSELMRVLKPGGRIAIYDILSGPGGEVYFPVPWARDTSTSFLLSSRQLLDKLTDIGFEILVWRDVTEAGRSWFRNLKERMRPDSKQSSGLEMLLGYDFRQMTHNQFLNLEEERINLIEAVVRRPFYC